MLTIVPFFAVGFVPFDFGYFSDLSTKSMIFPVVMCNLFFISYFIKFPPDKKVYKIYYILIIVLTLISPVRNLTYRINEIAKDEKEVDTRFLLKENNWKNIKETNYNIAVLPWGATEAHNYHLPFY